MLRQGRSSGVRFALVLLGVVLLVQGACSAGGTLGDAGADFPPLVPPDLPPVGDASSPLDVSFQPIDGGAVGDAGEPDVTWRPIDAGDLGGGPGPDAMTPDDGGSDGFVPIDAGGGEDQGGGGQDGGGNPGTCPDPGENDDRCPGDQLSLDEGETQTLRDRVLSPATDADTFSLFFAEGSHFCFPGSGQSYSAVVQFTPAAGSNLQVFYNLDACSDAWTPLGNTGVCFSWEGTCAANDDIELFLQVRGTPAPTCAPYTVSITFCNEGETCPGC